MSDKLEYVQSVIKSCSLPELKQDLDSLPIQSEHFQEYHKVLEQQLPDLYDFVQQNESWLWESKESENLEVHASLIILLCELTAPGVVYSLGNKYLLQNADKVLQHKVIKLPEKVKIHIFAYYQSKLKTDVWKRQLGAVHGFIRYLEVIYNNTKPGLMSDEWLRFCLSVGLNLRDCHEPTYKYISTRIFQIMLQAADRRDVLNLNIHSVVYDAVFKNVHLMENVIETAEIWNCLLLCLQFYDDIDSLSWNQVDDMMETLIRNITLAPDSIVSICLLKFISKCGYYFSVNRKEIENKLNCDINASKALVECRVTCSKNTSYTTFRWAKIILQIFISEAYKLMAGAKICRELLQEMHRCYMVYILPIRLEIVKLLLITFWDKFTAALMESLAIHKNDTTIVNLVKMFLETFRWQLKNSPINDTEISIYRQSFDQLLNENIFCK